MTSLKGKNPLDDIYLTRNDRKVPFSSLYKAYYWNTDNGYANMRIWIEEAAKAAGK
jgi:hypothetical protein